MANAPRTEGTMTIWEHLDELRRRLMRAGVAYVVGAGIAWTYREPILAWLWKPFADSWRAQHLAGDPALNFSAPSDAFLAYLKLSLVGGLLIAAPVIFLQIWGFIAPGLYKKEKWVVIPFVVSSTVLFVGGGLFGWRVAFPITFNYFLGLAGNGADVAGSATGSAPTIKPVIMMAQYLDFVSQMLLAFGIIFELPLFILFLSIVGLVNYLQLIRFARWFILVAFVIGAIVSPPDITSQIAMSVPLCLLYFVSIGLAYLFGKRPSPEEIAREKSRRRLAKEAKKADREARLQAKKAERDARRKREADARDDKTDKGDKGE